MAEYIEREAALSAHKETKIDAIINKKSWPETWQAMSDALKAIPAADVVEVVSGYHKGDVCIYGFGGKNKSRAIVEIVKILNDERGVAEVKFLKVFVDDTGNGLFNYLLKSKKTMNASFQYLKNITPRKDGEV